MNFHFLISIGRHRQLTVGILLDLLTIHDNFLKLVAHIAVVAGINVHTIFLGRIEKPIASLLELSQLHVAIRSLKRPADIIVARAFLYHSATSDGALNIAFGTHQLGVDGDELLLIGVVGQRRLGNRVVLIRLSQIDVHHMIAIDALAERSLGVLVHLLESHRAQRGRDVHPVDQNIRDFPLVTTGGIPHGIHLLASGHGHGLRCLHVSIATVTIHGHSILVGSGDVGAAHGRNRLYVHDHLMIIAHLLEIELPCRCVLLGAVHDNRFNGETGVGLQRPGHLGIAAILHRLGGRQSYGVLIKGAHNLGFDLEVSILSHRRLRLHGLFRRRRSRGILLEHHAHRNIGLKRILHRVGGSIQQVVARHTVYYHTRHTGAFGGLPQNRGGSAFFLFQGRRAGTVASG